MSYEPTNWKSGDKVTSTRLNKIEQGIQGIDNDTSSIKEDLTSNIAEVTGKMQKVASVNLLDANNILADHSCDIYGVTTESAGYKCTNDAIPVSEGDVLRFYYFFRGNVVLSDMRFVTAYNASGVVVSASSAQNVSSYTVPSGIAGVKITFLKNSDLPPMLTKNHEASEYEEYYTPYYIATNDFVPDVTAEVDSIKVARSGNVLNMATLQSGYSITASGGLVENSGYATTDFIEVKEGDVVVASFNTSNAMTIARLVTYRQDKSVIDGSTSSVTSYTVPSGVSYIRFCANNAYMMLSTARINLDGIRHPFEAYYSGDVNAIAQKNGTDIFNVLNYPLTSLPEYILKNLCYKPLGALSKGYICIVSDDGDEAVASYTIPMVIAKNVPCTFAMMQASPVLATQSGIATVKDAVDNHGCCVAQHGGFTTPYWNTMDEYVLNDFFNSEAEYWNNIGITPHGACAPGHQVNDMVRALAGGRFGCHRAAYFDGAPWYGDTYYINGPRSNMYSLTSQNIAEGDLNYWKAKCDMTLAQKWLMMIHLHEDEMDASDKSQLESVIDYAKSIGLTFITMADIPTII